MPDSPSGNPPAILIGLALAIMVLGVAVGSRGCVKTVPGPIGIAGFGSGHFLNMESPEVARAVQDARAALVEFKHRLATPRDGDKEFRVLVRFASMSEVEYLWVRKPKFDGDKVTGELTEDAAAIATLHRGMPVEFGESSIFDWEIETSDGLVGGNTKDAAKRAQSR